VEANRLIVAELSLSDLLRRIVEAAREILSADYAALGVIGSDGLLEQFVHTGMDQQTVTAIGALPKGQGVLGALLTDPQAIRLESIAADPRSVGFPPHHPPMSAFLGVPIRSRNRIFGNLYLTNGPDGAAFSADDEELAGALAATAGTAIENARLYEEAEARQEWLRASAEISRELVESDTVDHSVLRPVADSVRRLARADVVSIVLPADPPGTLDVAVASGVGAGGLEGVRYSGHGSLAWQAIQEKSGLIAPDVDISDHIYVHMRRQVPVTQAMALPLQGRTASHGAIVVGRVARLAFTAADLEMAASFAGQAALALELIDVRADRVRLAALEDRERIARDLHEHVVQRLFAAGMRLEGMASLSGSPVMQSRLQETVDDIDDTIRRIRTSIFALQGRPTHQTSLRSMALSLIAELTPVLGVEPRLLLDGPLDTLSDAAITADVEAVLRETLTNVAKHAHAQSVTVEISADSQQFRVVVTDDGVGLGPAQRRSGLENLRHRAVIRGGTFNLDEPAGRGLQVSWSIPIQL
jgi:signal transduction histidine kinase